MVSEAPPAAEQATPPASEQASAPASEQSNGTAPGAERSTAPEGTEQGAAPAEQHEPSESEDQGDGGSSAPLDLSTDEGIRAAIEVNPQLSSYITKVKADAENTGIQRARAQAAREFADEATVTAVVEAALKPDLTEEQRKAAVSSVFHKSQAAAGAKIIEGIASELVAEGEFEIPAEYVERATIAYLMRDPVSGQAQPDYDTWVKELVTGAAMGRIATMGIDDIPKGSRLEAEIQNARTTAIAAGVENELKARSMEQAKEQAPKQLPSAPGDGPRSPITSVEEARKLSAEEWAQMPEDERRELQRKLGQQS